MGEIITKTNKEVLQFFDEMKIRLYTIFKWGTLSDRHRIVRNAQTD